MAAKKGNKTGAVVRHDNPIGVRGVVDDLPPRQTSSAMVEVLAQIQAAEGAWVELDPAGRQLSSVQSMVSAAASNANIKVNCSIRGDKVYARIAPSGKKAAAAS